MALRRIFVKGGNRTAPRQLPTDFKSLSLVRSYAGTDSYGNIIHTEVRECPHSGIRVQARVNHAEYQRGA